MKIYTFPIYYTLKNINTGVTLRVAVVDVKVEDTRIGKIITYTSKEGYDYSSLGYERIYNEKPKATKK